MKVELNIREIEALVRSLKEYCCGCCSLMKFDWRCDERYCDIGDLADKLKDSLTPKNMIREYLGESLICPECEGAEWLGGRVCFQCGGEGEIFLDFFDEEEGVY